MIFKFVFENGFGIKEGKIEKKIKRQNPFLPLFLARRPKPPLPTRGPPVHLPSFLRAAAHSGTTGPAEPAAQLAPTRASPSLWLASRPHPFFHRQPGPTRQIFPISSFLLHEMEPSWTPVLLSLRGANRNLSIPKTSEFLAITCPIKFLASRRTPFFPSMP